MKRILGVGAAALAVLLVFAAFNWREDILRTGLDPKVPYQTYRAPPTPDYAQRSAWALLPASPATPKASDLPADVFFVHPTTYDGGGDWNGPIHEARADRTLGRVMLPNYAGPFLRVGRVFAPRYRQASLYSLLTLREDAREARQFAYGDVRDAFRYYLKHYNNGRPLVLVGVEQGGLLTARLLRDEVAADPALQGRLAVAYLIDTAVPRDAFGSGARIPACEEKGQAHCVVAWKQAVLAKGDVPPARYARLVYWNDQGVIEPYDDRPILCVNPLLGAAAPAEAPARLSLGAANATGLEWGTRPAFLSRQVSARCRDDGLLIVARPRSPSLQPSGSWTDRRKAAGFNLFYADLEADAQTRTASLLKLPGFPNAAAPIEVEGRNP